MSGNIINAVQVHPYSADHDLYEAIHVKEYQIVDLSKLLRDINETHDRELVKLFPNYG